MLDNSDFIDTDIPLEVSLPEKPGISVSPFHQSTQTHYTV